MRTQIGNSEFIFTITVPSPACPAATMAIMSYMISVIALQGLKLCFCTGFSLHLEKAASTDFWEPGQRDFTFTLTRVLCKLLHGRQVFIEES